MFFSFFLPIFFIYLLFTFMNPLQVMDLLGDDAVIQEDDDDEGL